MRPPPIDKGRAYVFLFSVIPFKKILRGACNGPEEWLVVEFGEEEEEKGRVRSSGFGGA